MKMNEIVYNQYDIVCASLISLSILPNSEIPFAVNRYTLRLTVLPSVCASISYTISFSSSFFAVIETCARLIDKAFPMPPASTRMAF
jgi:hypothetical protein